MVALNRLNQHVEGCFFCSPSDKNHRSNIASQMENTHAELQTDTCKATETQPFLETEPQRPVPPRCHFLSLGQILLFCSVSQSLSVIDFFSVFFEAFFTVSSCCNTLEFFCLVGCYFSCNETVSAAVLVKTVGFLLGYSLIFQTATTQKLTHTHTPPP